MPKADAIVRHDIWQKAMTGFEGDLMPVAQQFDFGPHVIAEAAAGARMRARLRGSPNPNQDDLWKTCREQSAWQAGGLAQPIVPAASFEDIVLPKDISNQLEEISAQVANRPRVYDDWGFGEKLSRGRGISALFSGPSGAGKTMAAEILANHLKLDLYRIDLAGMVSKYIGETEKNLKKVFDAAERSGAILFFDEADALFGKRTEVKDSHDRYANIEVNYLLQRMEEYRGLAILATNRKSFLDQAFMRRIRFIVDFPFPDAKSRRLIWQKMFPEESLLEYVFAWKGVPGKDEERLIDFLKCKFGIGWTAAKRIKKIGDSVIKIIVDDKSLSLELNDDKSEMTLKISDMEAGKFIAKDEDGKLNIYFREDIDYDALSRLEITGGNIRNISVNAAFLAAKDGVPIGMEHIMISAKREYAKIEKLLSEAEFGKYYKLVKS
jgi:SpoVK/Ycf46/Vps4 family AAA+-type ATPase